MYSLIHYTCNCPKISRHGFVSELPYDPFPLCLVQNVSGLIVSKKAGPKEPAVVSPV